MSPALRLHALLDLFQTVESDPRPLDAVTALWFRARRDLGSRDRGYLLSQIYDLYRHHARLKWWLEEIGCETGPRCQLLAWIALSNRDILQTLPDPLGTADTSPEQRQADNAVLSRLAKASLNHPDMPESVRLECPAWAEAGLRSRFGETFAAELTAMLAPPPVDLRVNPAKTSRKEVLRDLAALGLRGAVTTLAPQGIRVSERFDYARLAALHTGAVEIQDEGSQLVAALVGAQPGERVVDFCAGAGGKALALSAMMRNKGRLIACDVNEGRLKRCAERLRKAGVGNAETRLLTGETDKWVKRHKLGFDRVLVDAPCSGTGTWRRNPDSRWRGAEGLESLTALQSRILASAARLAKPGGRLVYATCSLLTAENEDQVARFLAATPEFRLVPLSEAAPDLAAKIGGDMLSLTPAQHDTDGFFAAVLERKRA